jgi:hypothetical protein
VKETQILKQIADYLRLHGAVVVRVNSGAVTAVNRGGGTRFVRFNDQEGCSDLLVALPAEWAGLSGEWSIFAAVEVKRPGGKLRDNQSEFLAKCRSRNVLTAVVTGLDSLREELSKQGVQIP